MNAPVVTTDGGRCSGAVGMTRMMNGSPGPAPVVKASPTAIPRQTTVAPPVPEGTSMMPGVVGETTNAAACCSAVCVRVPPKVWLPVSPTSTSK